MTSLDVVIVNWNSGDLLRECIASFAGVSRAGFELSNVIVVDNASVDGSADGLENIGVPLVRIANTTNVGFAAACNQGARVGHAEHVLFLNPDTRLFHSSLAEVVRFLEDHAATKVAVCGVQLLDGRGQIARSCVRFPTISRQIAHFFGLQYIAPRVFPRELMTEWDHSISRVVDQVMGAFFWVRRERFDELGGFDERFFVYYEELDFCLRAASLNWTTYYLASAQVYHKGGGTTSRVRATALFLFLRSRALFGYKHFGIGWGTLLLALALIIEPFSRTVFGILRREGPHFGALVAAYSRLYKQLPRLDVRNGVWP